MLYNSHVLLLILEEILPMKKQAFIFIILAGLLWGTSGIFVHYLAPFGFSSLQLVFFRTVVSTVVMLAYILATDKSLVRASRSELLLYAISGLCLFGTGSFYYISMRATSVSTAVVLMYTAPVIVMIYSVMFLGEKFTALKGVSLVCMLIGCALVSGIIGGLKFDAYGIIMGFMSGVSYSAYNILTKIQMRRGNNPITATLYCFGFAAIAALILCKPWGIAPCIAKSPAVTLPLLVTIGLATCVAPYFLYTLSLRALPVGTAAALGIVEPMAATVYSVVIFGEELGIYSICGIVLILGAVFLLSRSDG